MQPADKCLPWAIKAQNKYPKKTHRNSGAIPSSGTLPGKHEGTQATNSRDTESLAHCCTEVPEEEEVSPLCATLSQEPWKGGNPRQEKLQHHAPLAIENTPCSCCHRFVDLHHLQLWAIWQQGSSSAAMCSTHPCMLHRALSFPEHQTLYPLKKVSIHASCRRAAGFAASG